MAERKGGVVQQICDLIVFRLVDGIATLVQQSIQEVLLGDEEAPVVPVSALPHKPPTSRRKSGRKKKGNKGGSKSDGDARRQLVIEAVRDLRVANSQQVAKKTRFSRQIAGSVLYHLAQEKQLVRNRDGNYRLSK